MHDSKELRAMRAMAWERSKGELRSMYHTFYDGLGPGDEPTNLEDFKFACEKFFKEVEGDGLQE